MIETIDIIPQGSDFVLTSTNENISKIKKRFVGPEINQMMKNPLTSGSQSLNELLITGLVELCRVKPVDLNAVQWLGEWLLANNPNKPNVVDPDEE